MDWWAPWHGYAGTLSIVIRWFADAVADFIRGMHSTQKWGLVGVFAAMSLVWDAGRFSGCFRSPAADCC
jgi:hypothetical protein